MATTNPGTMPMVTIPMATQTTGSGRQFRRIGLYGTWTGSTLFHAPSTPTNFHQESSVCALFATRMSVTTLPKSEPCLATMCIVSDACRKLLTRVWNIVAECAVVVSALGRQKLLSWIKLRSPNTYRRYC